MLEDVAAYNIKLNAAFSTKGKKNKGKGTSSVELNAAHDAMGKQLFSNFLILTDIFIDDTSIVLNYFDFSLLSRVGKQMLGIQTERLSLKPGTHKAAKNQLAADHKIYADNKSKTAGFYFLASSADAPVSTILTEIPVSTRILIPRDSEGASEKTFIIFVNTDSSRKLRIEVETI